MAQSMFSMHINIQTVITRQADSPNLIQNEHNDIGAAANDLNSYHPDPSIFAKFERSVVKDCEACQSIDPEPIH